MSDAKVGGDELGCECIVPVLSVRDLEASLRFYEGLLGFGRDWGGDEAHPQIASVSVAGHSIMLVRDSAPPATVWIGVADVAALHRRLVAQSAAILQPPTNQPWALEMRVADPDANVLWFGSDPLAEEERPYGT